MKLSAVVVLLSVISLALCASATETQAGTPFSFSEFFQGDWDVQRAATALGSNTYKYDELLGHYKIDKDNSSTSLFGRSFDNNTATGEISNDRELKVEFDSVSSGRFLSGNTEFDFKTLFTFDFVTHPNGVVSSQGRWLDGDAEGVSHYQFSIPTTDKFVLTVYPAGAKGAPASQQFVFFGRKVVVTPPKTFFQQYGMFVMIFVMMGVNMFIQSRAKSGAFAPDTKAIEAQSRAAAAPKKKD